MSRCCKKALSAYNCSISDQGNKPQEQLDGKLDTQNEVDQTNRNQETSHVAGDGLVSEQPSGNKPDESVKEMTVDDAKPTVNAEEKDLKFTPETVNDVKRDKAFQDENGEDGNTLDNMDYKEEKDDEHDDDEEDDDEEDEDERHKEDHRKEEDKTEIKDAQPEPPVEPPTKLEDNAQTNEEIKQEDKIVPTQEPEKEADEMVKPKVREEHTEEADDVRKDEEHTKESDKGENAKLPPTMDKTLEREAEAFEKTETTKQESEPSDGGGSLLGNMFNGKSTAV